MHSGAASASHDRGSVAHWGNCGCKVVRCFEVVWRALRGKEDCEEGVDIVEGTESGAVGVDMVEGTGSGAVGVDMVEEAGSNSWEV